MRWTFLLGWGFTLTVAGAIRVRGDDPPAPTFTNVTVHDPSVVRDGATFYVFGSHLAAASTTDLMRWTQIPSDMTSSSLIRNGTPLVEFAPAFAYSTVQDFWAPDAIKLADGNYYYYYCTCQGSSPLSAMGIAKASAISGPYADAGIILRSAGATPTVSPYDVNTMPNVVDPSVFYDQAGTLRMVYGSFSGGIFILRLDQASGSPTLGQPVAGQGYGKKLIGGNSSRIEGPYIFYSPETAYYYLFMTFGGLDSTGGYNIRCGRSLNPDGPFLDPAGNDLTNVKGNFAFDDATIAPSGAKLMGNWQFLHVSGETLPTSRGYVSPGGCSVYRDAATARHFLVFHTRFVGQGEVHEVRVHQFYFNSDGWPVVAPHRYAGETIGSTDAGRIVGNYKLINHGKDITATVKTSTAITLNFDGSITGSSTGTWQLSSGHFATLTIGGTAYKGVFSRQWDDDNQTWVLTFSALAANGTAIWGSKVTIATAPTVLTAPASQSVQAGTSVAFSVLASGDPAPTYQWRKDGVNLSGATGSTYTITSASAGDAGSYTVVATNSAGSVTSAAATLSLGSGTGLTVSTVAGLAGSSGTADGTGSAARFSSPADVAVDSSGNVFIADTNNNSIRKLTPAGAVTTFATGFNRPAGVAVDSSGNLYVADTNNNSVRKVSSTGTVTTLASGFNGPSGIAVDGTGTVYVADTLNHTIARVTSAGAVSVLAGSAGGSGAVDANGTAARFFGPQGLALDGSGSLYVADTNNCTIRRVTIASSAVTTVAGAAGATGNADGTGSAARFFNPSGVAVDSAGTICVADTDNHTLRTISTAGGVTTVAGSSLAPGAVDGVGNAARFNFPAGIAADSSGSFYVADTGNHTIRLAYVPAAPAITTQPQSQTVTAGSGAQFSVVATGRPAPTYQWNFGGSAIAGATSSTYSISSAQSANAGDYTVTVANSSGSVTSSRATLTVNASSGGGGSSGGGSSGGGGGGGAIAGWWVALGSALLLARRLGRTARGQMGAN